MTGPCPAAQVSVMPCTAKKYEAERGEMAREGEGPDVGEQRLQLQQPLAAGAPASRAPLPAPSPGLLNRRIPPPPHTHTSHRAQTT
jgi:hypothetical protein